MKIVMVLTSHDRLGDTGRKTGFWLEELAAPYYAFQDAGAEIVLASRPKADSRHLIQKATNRLSKLILPAVSRPTPGQRRNWPPPCVWTASQRPTSTRCFIRAVMVRCGTCL